LFAEMKSLPFSIPPLGSAVYEIMVSFKGQDKVKNAYRTAFIVGCQRSGTTILGDILQAHAGVAYIYEPYYIWYFHAKDISTDYISLKDIGTKETLWIRKQFRIFCSKMGKTLVIDKSPEHSFNLPFVYSVFPNAKFIHIFRDGRDVVLSIKKEWEKRRNVVEKRSFSRLFRIAGAMLRRQPLWYFRFLAVWYEMKTNLSLTPTNFLNKAKWQGGVGWGPRFRGWQEILRSEPLIRFNAYQWLKCIEQIQHDLPQIPEENVLELRYEELISEDWLHLIKRILEFLELPFNDSFVQAMPKIMTGNTQKWQNELTEKEINEIGPLLSDKLIELGYEKTKLWHGPQKKNR